VGGGREGCGFGFRPGQLFLPIINIILFDELQSFLHFFGVRTVTISFLAPVVGDYKITQKHVKIENPVLGGTVGHDAMSEVDDFMEVSLCEEKIDAMKKRVRVNITNQWLPVSSGRTPFSLLWFRTGSTNLVSSTSTHLHSVPPRTGFSFLTCFYLFL